MNGAECLVRTAEAAGITTCFANPGTTEMPLVAALDASGGVRTVLGLFEGVCTGAADGWGRMTGGPAMVLLHLGPGLANGLANLHNARRAHTPLLCVVGEHATWHRDADAPLASDIESLARPMSGWVHTTERADALGSDTADAIAAAWGPPGAVATLVAPADCQWEEAGAPARAPQRAPAAAVDADAVKRAAERLRAGGGALLLGAVGADGLRHAARIAAASGAKVYSETFPSRLERGAGLPDPERLAYFPEAAVASLSAHDTLVLVGAHEPVAFFGYPEGASRLARPEQQLELTPGGTGGSEALAALADALDAPTAAPEEAPRDLPSAPDGPLDPEKLGIVLARAQPKGAIVVDEGLTSAGPWWALAAAAAPHTTLTLTGGAIGQGLPCATGAALACPDRRVIALQADGSGLYTLQALWTQAREGLDVTTVVCANRSYRILQIELHRAGVAEPGPIAQATTDLGSPAADWVALARGFGVPASRAETAEDLAAQLAASFATPGPHLIEVPLP